MTNIKDKLKEVADYFKNKVIEGDFKFVSCGDHTAKILIDDEFEFEMWISNDPKDDFRFYEGSFLKNSIFSDVFDFRTQKNRLKAWRKLKPYVDKYRSKVILSEKRRAFNLLKKQIEEYER